jgi:hypothetical protein
MQKEIPCSKKNSAGRWLGLGLANLRIGQPEECLKSNKLIWSLLGERK